MLSLSVDHLAKGSRHDVEGVPLPVLDGPLDDDVLVLLMEDDLTPLSEVLQQLVFLGTDKVVT